MSKVQVQKVRPRTTKQVHTDSGYPSYMEVHKVLKDLGTVFAL
jgi:hypothetical protein